MTAARPRHNRSMTAARPPARPRHAHHAQML
eukprot:CAMPEP_0119382774 /NCGR_PEP_ID=MMETSP1334-20130426/74743_1 /TAXON_ID=127549 /ORGANISM="Calcidiscus leptoporus, Strain RCC1130" /LENGTH=30 /DNA_ID= /DNA_START= /DNA_END= /DNA_ORIENTATION=